MNAVARIMKIKPKISLSIFSDEKLLYWGINMAAANPTNTVTSKIFTDGI
jgi:hypothetical protein